MIYKKDFELLYLQRCTVAHNASTNRPTRRDYARRETANCTLRVRR